MKVIHHWDTDGIASAAKLRKIFDPGAFENVSPPIGDFSFDERIEDMIRSTEELFVVDLNLPHLVEDIERRVTFIDHHVQKSIRNDKVVQINPLVEGASADAYPSATTVISHHYDSWDILSLLGAVGDVGDKAFDIDPLSKILDSQDLTKGQIKELVHLIDSNYISMDQKGVEQAVDLLYKEDPEDLLDNGEWKNKVRSIEDTMERALDRIEEYYGFAYIDFSSPYNVISKLARKATWDMGYPGSLVVNRDFNGKAQTYLRVNDSVSEEMDIPALIEEMRSLGVNAGGKKVVMGSFYDPSLTDEVLSRIKIKIQNRKEK